MKIFLYSILLFLSFSVAKSQTIDIDSLCSFQESNHIPFKSLPQICLYYITDSTKALNKRYYSESETSLHGWYYFQIQCESPYSTHLHNSSQIIGVYPETTATTVEGSLYQYVRVEGCFNDGEPCCTWQYTIESANKEKRPFYKTVNFKDGLLDGEYKIYKGHSNVIYETFFENGTGYYKEYMHDPLGKLEVKLKIEGALINGLRQGEWKYYIYNDYGKSKYIEIVTDTFDMGNHVTTTSTKKKK